MTQGIHPKPVKEDFFNQDSNLVWYMLGLLVDTYLPLKDSNKGVIFRSRSYDALSRIKNALECDHTIVSDNRNKNSHFFQVTSRGLRLSLEERGLTPYKRDRRFPEGIPEEFIPDYVRGFIENENLRQEIITRIALTFNIDYLSKLNEILIKYADIMKESITRRSLVYRISDTIKIHKFIYQNDNGLYLPEVKGKFRLKTPYSSRIKRTDDKVEIVKRLLREGKKGIEISKELGDTNSVSFYTFFRRHAERGIKEFIR